MPVFGIYVKKVGVRKTGVRKNRQAGEVFFINMIKLFCAFDYN